MNKTKSKIKRPSILLLATELTRAASELGWFYATQNSLTKEKRGDGHPVLVLPGFMTSDMTTGVLRRYIDAIGYQSFTWNLGRNTGKEVLRRKVVERLIEVYEETGKKVSIVGWSLGGVYARQVAKEHPDKVRQVITLGSPFSGIQEPNSVNWIYKFFNKNTGAESLDTRLVDDLPKPAPVPTTAIYTKEDGIVSWKVCREQDLNDYRQNVQVRSSHIGMGVNPIVLKIIADRLQYRMENWQKYEPTAILDRMLFSPAF